MKRTIYILTMLLALLPLVSNAQSKEAKKQIEAARIALITERLELTPDQAEKFWPVFREYDKKRQQLRMELRQTRKGVDPQQMSEDESRALMAKALEIKQKELDLEKDYSKRFTRVLSSQQVLSLSKAEKDFQQMLMKRINEQRRNQQIQRQRMQEKQRQWRQQKNN